MTLLFIFMLLLYANITLLYLFHANITFFLMLTSFIFYADFYVNFTKQSLKQNNFNICKIYK